MNFTLILCLMTMFSTGLSERILFLTPVGTKSHKIFYMGITEALAARGHHVTMVSSYNQVREIKNVREVVVKNLMMDIPWGAAAFENPTSAVETVFKEAPRLCVESLADQNVQDLKNESFDLVILSVFFDHCYLSLVHHFQVPYIFASPAGIFASYSNIMNNPEFPSIVPNIIQEATFPLSFRERLTATFINTIVLRKSIHLEDKMDEICREKGLCPPDMPHIRIMNQNASLEIINSVRLLETPRPMMPNIIYAGGAHIKPPKKLPEDLENWIANSGDDGFILFSLGSALKTSDLPKKHVQILLDVFGSLKQRVLCKLDETELKSDLPANLKLSKWFPQSDILGHPKLRLFITHGGLLSTQEATYHGVPVIGMPVFADQFANMREGAVEGWAKVVYWKELEEHTFRKLIIETINDPSLKEVAKRRSALMKDTPMPPDQEAAFWVEYVIRHKGAPHIKSPLRMMWWYEIYNMDVWTFIIGIILATVYSLYILLRWILRIACGVCRPETSKSKLQ